jgi:hypothetical protein
MDSTTLFKGTLAQDFGSSFYFIKGPCLKGHSHKNVFEIIILNDRLGPNKGTPTLL